MKKTLLIFALLIGCINAYSQDFMAQFKTLVAKKDTAAELNLLKQWQASKPDDAELFVAYFNLYVQRSVTEMISLSKKQSGDQSLQLQNTDDKKTAGFLNDEVYYKSDEMKRAFSYIDMGIAKYPSRLDMRFGKVYMLGEMKEYDKFTNEIIAAINYGNTIKYQWTWANNLPHDTADKFMLGAVQDYFIQLYNAGDDQAENLKKIAEAVLKYYPNSVESLSDLAVSYIIKKDYDHALLSLFKAQKIAPTDYIVLNNIADCYSLKNDTDNAIKYYELTYKYGDDNAKAQADEKLKELKKQPQK